MNVTRIIALFELVKGLLVLIVFAVTRLYSLDVGQSFYAKIVSHLHPESFTTLILVLLYSVLRLLEAYGLWFQKKWGRILAIISIGIYIPFECIAIYKEVTVLKVLITLLNLVILGYLLRKREIRIWQT